jgi:hypothetical protein
VYEVPCIGVELAVPGAELHAPATGYLQPVKYVGNHAIFPDLRRDGFGVADQGIVPLDALPFGYLVRVNDFQTPLAGAKACQVGPKETIHPPQDIINHANFPPWMAAASSSPSHVTSPIAGAKDLAGMPLLASFVQRGIRRAGKSVRPTLY